jgi:hypothetical protein
MVQTLKSQKANEHKEAGTFGLSSTSYYEDEHNPIVSALLIVLITNQMSIPNQQIETWSNQGAITTSSLTYTSIKTALKAGSSPIAALIASGTVKIDLQGSYAHDTNIYGDSDVDVIVHHSGIFYSNKLQLPVDQYQLHEQSYNSATYNWADLRNDIITALSSYYGANYIDSSGKKSLKVLPTSGRLRLDVVPVMSYRNYSHFHGTDNHSRVDGVSFNNAVSGEQIINYPDQHYNNAVTKHGATNSRYKGIVRAFKNMRSYLVDKGRLTKEEAPSYFIQGMIYNAPDGLFVADKTTTTLNVLQWLNRANLNTFISQNGQHPLIGEGPHLWPSANAQKTIKELSTLWNNWGNI